MLLRIYISNSKRHESSIMEFPDWVQVEEKNTTNLSRIGRKHRTLYDNLSDLKAFIFFEIKSKHLEKSDVFPPQSIDWVVQKVASFYYTLMFNINPIHVGGAGEQNPPPSQDRASF